VLDEGYDAGNVIEQADDRLPGSSAGDRKTHWQVHARYLVSLCRGIDRGRKFIGWYVPGDRQNKETTVLELLYIYGCGSIIPSSSDTSSLLETKLSLLHISTLSFTPTYSNKQHHHVVIFQLLAVMKFRKRAETLRSSI
jgi:hypothetical protein